MRTAAAPDGPSCCTGDLRGAGEGRIWGRGSPGEDAVSGRRGGTALPRAEALVCQGQDARAQTVPHFVLAQQRHRPALSMGAEGTQHPGASHTRPNSSVPTQKSVNNR